MNGRSLSRVRPALHGAGFETCRTTTAALALLVLTAGPVGGRAENEPATPAVRAGQTNAPASPAPRPPRRLEEEELRDLLTGALNQGIGTEDAEWEVRFSRPWTPVSVPDEPLKAEIVEPALNRITSSSVLRFELRAGGRLAGAWQVPVQARLWRDVLVARANLQRGLPLKEAPLAHERRDVLTLRNPLAELPPNAAACEVAEGVPAGSPLLARAVRLRPVVFRGQIADAVVRDGAMMISLKVEVLEEGIPGQMVRVRNSQSRRELRGKVQDEHTITIPL
jgi:flagella basal body P-ring formation protein FlgA